MYLHFRIWKILRVQLTRIFNCNYQSIDQFISDEYTIEYSDPEYTNTFDDEVTQNDGEQQSSGQRRIPDKSDKSSDSRVRRTYPKCAKCNKRFVYKEVYEAHIRIHKGLPGFS